MEKEEFFSLQISISSKNMAWGIDGCRGGWLAIGLKADQWVCHIEDSLEKLAPILFSSHSLCFIDMPIGLPDQKERERSCDRAARQYLSKGRKSSVFSLPSREILASKTYQEALASSKRIYGKGLSVQSWNLFPKVRELDLFLTKRNSPELWESHPEICFQHHKGSAVEFSKHKEEGLLERIKILQSLYPMAESCYSSLAKSIPKKIARPDDILDAFVLALSANLALNRQYISGLIPTQYDSLGLPMNYHL